MKKMYKIIITVITILFFVCTMALKVYYNAGLEEILLISIINSTIGFMTGACICLIIRYPKTKDFYCLITTTLFMIIALIFFGMGIAVNQMPNYFLLVTIILVCIIVPIAIINLRKLRKKGQ